ncbi:MAG: hypothetical protein JNL01_01325 [Bdellovibrionales bacterium]|nr:hypothetical protein [Bdellovibrionales bacterium]
MNFRLPLLLILTFWTLEGPAFANPDWDDLANMRDRDVEFSIRLMAKYHAIVQRGDRIQFDPGSDTAANEISENYATLIDEWIKTNKIASEASKNRILGLRKYLPFQSIAKRFHRVGAFVREFYRQHGPGYLLLFAVLEAVKLGGVFASAEYLGPELKTIIAFFPSKPVVGLVWLAVQLKQRREIIKAYGGNLAFNEAMQAEKDVRKRLDPPSASDLLIPLRIHGEYWKSILVSDSGAIKRFFSFLGLGKISLNLSDLKTFVIEKKLEHPDLDLIWQDGGLSDAVKTALSVQWIYSRPDRDEWSSEFQIRFGDLFRDQLVPGELPSVVYQWAFRARYSRNLKELVDSLELLEGQGVPTFVILTLFKDLIVPDLARGTALSRKEIAVLVGPDFRRLRVESDLKKGMWNREWTDRIRNHLIQPEPELSADRPLFNSCQGNFLEYP